LGLDEHCLSLVLYHPQLLAQADQALRACEEEPLCAEDLSRPEDRVIWVAWRQWLDSGNPPDARAAFYDTLDENLQQRVDLLIEAREDQPPAPPDLLKDKVLDLITQLRLRNLQRQNYGLHFLQEEAQALGDREAFRRYGQLTSQIATRIRRLERAINERSLSGRRQREDAAIRKPFIEERYD